MAKRINEIISVVKDAKIIGDASREITQIAFDSRKADAEAMFVAQKGVANDGHKYINQVLSQGCRAIVCEDMPTEFPQDACIITTSDTHEALGLLASAFYDFPSKRLKLVGVTGTNGKTTIATLLYRLLNKLGHKSGLFSTVQNNIGEKTIASTHTTPDAVTLNAMMQEMVDAGCEYCFMEVSSHSIVQRRIAGLEFTGGIFTNITHDHLDYHKTFEAYIKAKKAFFDGLSCKAFAITNLDDKNGEIMLQNTAAKKMTYSLIAMADFKAEILEQSFEGMNLKINGTDAFMQFVGKFNASNLLAIYATAISLGFDKNDVLTAMSSLVPVDGRFQTIHSTDGRVAIIDYAHTPDALLKIISAINEIRKNNQKLICVVGCGGDRDKTKRPEMAFEAAKGCSVVILTSDNPRSEDPNDIINDMKASLDNEALRKTITIVDRREAIRTALTIAQPGDIVLLAGKGHETYQETKGVRTHFSDKEEVYNVFKLN